jgi:hypothetical protein
MADSTDLFAHFSILPDPRVERTKKHRLIDILFIAVCTMICGGESFTDMELFGEADLTVADIATLSPLTCFPDQTVGEALAQLEGREVGRIPVVDRLDPGRVLGILRRQNIIAAYAQLLKEHSSLQSASQRLRLSVPGLVSLQVTIPAGAEAIGIPLSSVAIPSDALLIAVRRQGRTVIPRGETALAAGDALPHSPHRLGPNGCAVCSPDSGPRTSKRGTMAVPNETPCPPQ